VVESIADTANELVCDYFHQQTGGGPSSGEIHNIFNKQTAIANTDGQELGAKAIQEANERHPLDITLKLTDLGTEACFPQWKSDMAIMVAEASRKFVSTLTVSNIRDGLNLTIEILSLGLYCSTAGVIDPDAWLLNLRNLGIRGVSKLAIDRVRACAPASEENTVSSSPEHEDLSRRDLLVLCAKNGYPFLVERQLARWLIDHTMAGRSIKSNTAGTVGEDATPTDLYFYIFSRQCAISERALQASIGYHIRLSQKPFDSARERYDTIVNEIPADLRSALFLHGKSWFERCVGLKAKPRVKERQTFKASNCVPDLRGTVKISPPQ
jgi:hypothetical protein